METHDVYILPMSLHEKTTGDLTKDLLSTLGAMMKCYEHFDDRGGDYRMAWSESVMSQFVAGGNRIELFRAAQKKFLHDMDESIMDIREDLPKLITILKDFIYLVRTSEIPFDASETVEALHAFELEWRRHRTQPSKVRF